MNSGAHRFIYALRRSRSVAQAIFGVKVLPVEKKDYYFDITTVVLVKRLLKILKPGCRILDMGTGSSGIIGLSLWKKLKCFVISSDIDSEIVKLAKRNIDWNNAPIQVIQSRFFDAVTAKVDTVVFNPPYVPTAIGAGRGLLKERRCQWDGGNTGIEVIEDFLRALENVSYSLKAYIGVNSGHIPKAKMINLLEQNKRISVEEIYKDPVLPVNIYIIHI